MIQDAFIRLRAKQLYWQGYPPAEISRLMGINSNTVYSWKKRDEWDDTTPIKRVTQSIDTRLCQLSAKDNKTSGDFKEIDLLTRQLKKLDTGQASTITGVKKTSRRKKKNHFSEEQIEALRLKILDSLAWHQRGWYEQRDQRNRMILKSRQIGATWYFAREALLGALRTDVKHDYQRNQIFLSASRKQALQFRNFIRKAAEEVDVELKGGEQITLSNGAELHFLGTSAATAQSYTGHLRFDEFFWTGNFINLRKVAGAMATLKGLTRTYFSTPSSESHEAYQFWTGDRWNAKRPKAQRVDFDVSWKKTHSGVLYPDKTWRQSSLFRMLSITAGTTPTLMKSGTKTAQMNLKTCTCASSSKTAKARSILASYWGAALTGMTTGPTGNRSPVALWANVRCGWATTPTAAAAMVMPVLCP